MYDCLVYLNMIIEEVRLQIVHTEFQRPQPLTDESLRSIEGRDERVHQHMEVRKEGTETNGDRQTELHKEVFHVLLVLSTLKPVETCNR